MNLFLRLIRLLLTRRLRPAAELFDPVRTAFRVMPTDLDVLRHVNNGVYLSLLDLGRMDLLGRVGLTAELRRRGWYPVVTAESIGFRRSLTLFQRFEVETRLLGWDDTSLFLQQRFIRGDDVIASALVVGRFLQRGGGSIAPDEVAALAGHEESPPLPDWAHRLGADQERLRLDAHG